MLPGNKCKFSHDKNVERKAEKVNLYEDTRAKPVDKKLGELQVVQLSDAYGGRYYGYLGRS